MCIIQLYNKFNGGVGMDKYTKFIKDEYKKGNIKDVSEAFKEYPPEEEWHHGEIDYFISEPSFHYNARCVIGDIVFVREYLYNDGTKGRNHLFVIVENDYQAVPIEYFGMIISSQLNKLKYNTNVLLYKDDKNNLDRDSIVKVDEIYRLAKEQIVFVLGKVNIKKANKYKKLHYEIINK